MVRITNEKIPDPPNKTTIKVSNELRNKLAEVGKKDETFEEVIWRVIRRAEADRSGEVVTSKSSVIQYKRKKEFVALSMFIRSKGSTFGPNVKNVSVEGVGFEYEYNVPPRKEGEWELDIKIIKVYYMQKTYNPSEFFGVDNEDNYLSDEFTNIYFVILSEILVKEFGITKLKGHDYFSSKLLDILSWRKIYYENKLSQESFISDVEDVLRKFSDRQLDEKTKKQIRSSVAGR